jgi:5-(carboxyamino)imidazole ribonucleotide synthase
MVKAGILGGGQLGRMLLQAAANYPVETWVLEDDDNCPAAHLCHHFVKGDIRNFDDVYRFGKDLHALTIEIESVNVDALEKLESEGVKIYPRPGALRTINNKITQKKFYSEHGIPTAEFIVTENLAALRDRTDFLPAVHKIGTGGYDGRGVQIIRTKEDIDKGFDSPGRARKNDHHRQGDRPDHRHQPKRRDRPLSSIVDMVFDSRLNLLDYQICPADLPQNLLWKIEAISLRVVKELKTPGIFAVELFAHPPG